MRVLWLVAALCSLAAPVHATDWYKIDDSYKSCNKVSIGPAELIRNLRVCCKDGYKAKDVIRGGEVVQVQINIINGGEFTFYKDLGDCQGVLAASSKALEPGLERYQ